MNSRRRFCRRVCFSCFSMDVLLPLPLWFVSVQCNAECVDSPRILPQTSGLRTTRSRLVRCPQIAATHDKPPNVGDFSHCGFHSQLPDRPPVPLEFFSPPSENLKIGLHPFGQTPTPPPKVFFFCLPVHPFLEFSTFPESPAVVFVFFLFFFVPFSRSARP